MNAKPNSIRILPAMNSSLGVQGLGETIARAGIAYAVRTQVGDPPGKAHFWSVPADDRLGELWETLIYLVLWVCGLTGVAFCFL